MAKNVNHIQHVRSNVVENNLPKLPAANVLLEGELAVNYAKDKETISLKNSSGEVVTFSSDYYFSEKKLGEAFIGENSATTVTDVIYEDERVIAESLNDLNLRKLDASAYTPTDLSNYYTKTQVDDKIGVVSGNVNTISGNVNSLSATVNTVTDNVSTISGRVNTISGNVNTISGNVNTLSGNLSTNYYTTANTYSKTEVDNALAPYFDDAEYDSNSKRINFKHNGTVKDYIDATDFIKDGMVSSAYTSAVTIDSATTNYLVIEFNTDAGKDDVLINLNDVFDPQLYYTKEEIDDDMYVIASSLNDLNDRKLDASAYTGTDLTEVYNMIDSLSGVVEENEIVAAAALNNLNTRKLDASAYTEVDLSNYYTKSEIDVPINDLYDITDGLGSRINAVSGRVNTISGSVNTISGNVNSISGNVNTISGNVNSLSATVNTVTGNVSTLSGNVNTISGNVNSLSATVNTVTGNVSTLSGNVNTISGNVNSLSGDVTALSASMSGFVTTVKFEDKLGSGFTGENSGRTITQVIVENELVIAGALNDLNDRKLDVSAYTPTDLTNYYTKSQVDTKVNAISGVVDTISGRVNTISGKVDSAVMSVKMNGTTNNPTNGVVDLGTVITAETQLSTGNTTGTGNAVTNISVSNHQISLVKGETFLTNASITGLSGDVQTLKSNVSTISGNVNTLSGNLSSNYYTTANTYSKTEVDTALAPYFDDAEYDSNSKRINFKHNGTVKDYIDATAFIKDGMVDNVAISAVTSGSSTVDCLVITFNTDSGKEAIKIPLSGIFNASNYYTKTEVDGKIDIVSGRVSTISGNVNTISGNVNTISGNVNTVSGNVNTISGNVNTISGNVNTISGNVNTISGNVNTVSGKVDALSAAMSGFVTTVEFENKLGSGFTGENSGYTLTQTLDEYELVVSAALTDLDMRKLDASAFTLSDYYTKDEIDNAELAISAALNDLNIKIEMLGDSLTLDDTFSYSGSSASTNAVQAQAIIAYLEGKELAIAAALTDLDSRLYSAQEAVDRCTPLSVFDDSISASTRPVEAQALYNVIVDNEYVTSTALNTLNTNLTQHASSPLHLPAVSAADNGKILMVVNGQWALVTPTTIYTGTGTPSASQGNDGDIYLQTS